MTDSDVRWMSDFLGVANCKYMSLDEVLILLAKKISQLETQIIARSL